MSRWTPCKRNDFIRKLPRLGFDGPFTGSRQQFMVALQHRMAIPSNAEYSVPQPRMIVREVENIRGREVSLEEWVNL